MFLYQPVVSTLAKVSNTTINDEDIDYIFGVGNQGIRSDLIGIISTWSFYYLLIHALYYIVGGFMKWYVKIVWPEAGTNEISDELSSLHIKSSEIAFPLYTFVPVLADLVKKKGWSSTCDTMQECGGITWSLFSFGCFILLLEFIVFFDHWYILHVWKWGKKNLKHDVHHQYEQSDEMTVWTGYAFDPLDGFSQGFGLVICQFLIPVPSYFVWILSLLIGTWTMYIHQGVPGLPWPLMGADYHFIHHKYNWYVSSLSLFLYCGIYVVTSMQYIIIRFNFGFFTCFWDWVFGTLKHPTKDDNWKAPKHKK